MLAEDFAPSIKTDCPRCFGTGMYPWPYEHGLGHPYNEACCDHRQPPNRADGLFGGNAHRLELAELDGRVAWVDAGIRNDVEGLWKLGIWTWVSCEGSPTQERYVGLVRPTDGQVEDARAFLGWVNSAADCDRREWPGSYDLCAKLEVAV